jgi:hypothetical protein
MTHHDFISEAHSEQTGSLQITSVAGLPQSQTAPGSGVAKSQFRKRLHMAGVSLICWLFASTAFGAIVSPIPDTRTVPWIPNVTIGVHGGIPTTRTEWTNLVTAGADSNGVVTCSALLQGLLNSCPSNRYVYVPPGRYKLATQVVLNGTTNHWTLRGAGRSNTFFFPANSAFGLDNKSYSSPVRVHGGLTKAVTNFSVVGDVSASVGFNCYIDSNNDRTNAHVIATDNSARLVLQVAKVISVVNLTNVTVWPPIYIDHPTELDPWFRYQTGIQTERIGFEDFSIEGSNTLTGVTMASGQVMMPIFGGQNCWFKGLGFHNGKDFAISLIGDLWAEIRECDFDYSATAGGGSGAGLIIMSSGSGQWIENNYIRNGNSPFVEANASSGYAVTYNYVTNAVSNDFHVGNPYDNHIPHSYMFVIEGNWGTTYQQDGYFGSASHGTLFRNYFSGYDPIKTGIPRCIDLNRWSTYFNIVGNVLGDTRSGTYWYGVTNRGYSQTQPVIYRLGFPYPGNTSDGVIAAHTRVTPGTDWRYPGSNNFMGVITSANGTGTEITGNFANVVSGDLLTLQSQLNTNLYYPGQTNYPRLAAVGDGTALGLTFNKTVSWTNGDHVYRIGADAFPTFQFDDIGTHLRHMNYDRTNNALVADASGVALSSNLPPSLIYESFPPPWMTNRAGAQLFGHNPTNGVVGDLSARSLFEDTAPAADIPAVPGFRKLNIRLQGSHGVTGPWTNLFAGSLRVLFGDYAFYRGRLDWE